MAKSKLRLVSPTIVNRTVTPRRRPNAELRTREYLTDREVARLTEAAKQNRYGHRDDTMVLLAYRHGLRASELVDLRWDQLDFNRAVLHVRRHACDPPFDRAGNASPSEAPARIRCISIRVRFGAWGTVLDGRLCQNAGTGCQRCSGRNQSSSAHAAARLRVQACQRWRRYPRLAGLPRPQEHPAHCALHRAGAD
jgi:Phage integrase family